MARILIVGGGCPGRRFAARMAARGHAVRITTRSETARGAIEAAGAECWIGTPDRLATLRGALQNVTIACWMLAGARGDHEQLAALHGSRLEFFLGQAIDTTVRGLVYDAWPVGGAGGVPSEVLSGGEQIVRSLTELNAIPLAVLGANDADATDGERDEEAWITAASGAVDSLLGVGQG